MERDTYFADLESFDKISLSHKAYSETKKNFADAVAQAMHEDTVQQKVHNLWTVVNGNIRNFDNTFTPQIDVMDSGQFMLIFNSFRDIGCFADMIHLYGRCPNLDFKEAPLVKELLALAYTKINRPEKALEVADEAIKAAENRSMLYRQTKREKGRQLLTAQSIKRPSERTTLTLAERLKTAERVVGYSISRKTVGSRAYEMKGRAYLTLSDNERDPVKKREYLELSAKSHEDGFEKTLDYSIGLRAVHRNIELGKKERAQQLARLVYFAALRDGAAESRKVNGEEKFAEKDFLLIGAALQAACISGQDSSRTDILMQRLERCPARHWQLDDMISSLGRVAESYPSPQLEKIRKTLNLKLNSSYLVDSYEKMQQAVDSAMPSIDVKSQDILKNNRTRAKAVAAAQKISDNALCDDVVHSGNPYALAIALKAGLLTKKDVYQKDTLCKAFIKSEPPLWLLEETQKQMTVIAKKFFDENTPDYIRAKEQAAYLKTFLPKKQTEKTENRAKLEALQATTYNYRGLASDFEGTNCIAGNMRFGGQLPDHAVSKKDIELFSGLLRMNLSSIMPVDKIPQGFKPDTQLNGITDPEKFMTVVDAFIRYHYGNENFAGTGKSLEDNALMRDENGVLKGTKGSSLEQGSEYDQTVNAFMHVCGKEKGKDENFGIDSRTNISAIFALGLGDCRHHAQVKQIMFDMWQKKLMNDALRTAFRAVKHDNADKEDAALLRFKDIYLTELRSTDVKVRIPVEMEQATDSKTGETWDAMYRPVLTKDGKFKEGDHVATLEEHTMTVLLKRNINGELASFGLRDAFYHNTYAWGHKDIPLEDITLVNGRPSVKTGTIAADEVESGKPLPVTLEPTNYNTGKRDVAVKDSTGNEVCLMGVPLDGFQTPARFAEVLRRRPQSETMLQRVLEWEQTVYQPHEAEIKQQREGVDFRAMHAENVYLLKNKICARKETFAYLKAAQKTKGHFQPAKAILKGKER